MPFFETEEVSLFYQTFNWENEHITPIVLIHAFSFPSDSFDEFISSFTIKYPEFARFVYFDMRGHGKTVCKEKVDMSEKVLVKDAIDFIEYLKIDKFCLMGMSTGGRVSYRSAMHFGERVKKLILMTPIPTSGLPLAGQPSNRDAFLSLKEVHLGPYDKFWAHLKLVEGGEYSANAHVWGPKFYEKAKITLSQPNDVLATFYDGYTTPVLDEDLQKVKCPVLITTGDKDFFFDQLVVDFRRKWGGPVFFHAIANSSHFHLVEETLQVVDVVGSFLKKAEK
eukprot:TRINITY_DN3499_c0_g1_i1.p1 TRINITY_DN3499_c0_g1~~TRINITY_DN3499_c0_g1_i1.p1  ORF type:complete len:317 (+),score=51.70 TRINITY_DN3499_c0_g1_i1:112-951(+)